MVATEISRKTFNYPQNILANTESAVSMGSKEWLNQAGEFIIPDKLNQAIAKLI